MSISSSGWPTCRACSCRVAAPPADTLKGKRDRAILATFLHHGLRCEELCGLRVLGPPEPPGRAPPARPGQRLEGPVRAPAHPLALERIHDYLEAAGHGGDAEGPLFRPLKNPVGQG